MKFQIEKLDHYTIMPNEFLNDKNLKLAAKGLLATFYNLPNNWDYSIAGLCKITNTGETAIRNALANLELQGYLTRKQTRTEKGTIDYLYIVHIKKQKVKPTNCITIKRFAEQQHIDTKSLNL